jgi:uncharacterized protein (TIGR03000 family)
MYRKPLLFTGLLLLAGAVIVATPNSGQARPHGGGFGGGHFGGFHGGFGGYHGGIYHGGFGHAFGYHPAFGYHHAYGYHRYYPGYYPYYAAYGYNPYPYNAYSYAYSGSAYDLGDAGSYGDVASTAPPESYSSSYPPSTTSAESDGKARVSVTVPAGARLWFEGMPTTSTGTVREFNSPPLTPGERYTYDAEARWDDNGHEVTQKQQVKVTAGAHVNVEFPVPTKTAALGEAR